MLKKAALLIFFACPLPLLANSVSDCLHGRTAGPACHKLLVNFYSHEQAMNNAALRHGVPAEIFKAVVGNESGYNRFAQSHVGARGLTQIMPNTAPHLRVKYSDLHQAHVSLDAGARYLAELRRQFGRWDLALAAYNAGPGRVRRAGNKIPQIRETRNYVRNVLVLAESFRKKGQGSEALLQARGQAVQSPPVAVANQSATGLVKVNGTVPPQNPDRTSRTLPVLTREGWTQAGVIPNAKTPTGRARAATSTKTASRAAPARKSGKKIIQFTAQ